MFFEEGSFIHTSIMAFAALCFLVALFVALWRVAKGPGVFDRVLALDLIGGLCLCLLVLFAIRLEQPVLLDAALAIAVISFLGTVAFARYLEKGGRE